jgi:hypothetical protein
MNYYLVDFENVKTDGIKDLAGVKENDVMVVFYSDQCKNITLDVMDSITRLNLQFSACKVKTGTKNALDFQLSSYLGYLIGKGEADAHFYIVSNDKGYDCLCDYWAEQNVKVERIILQEQAKEKKETAKPQKDQKPKKKSKVSAGDMATLEEIGELLSEDDEPDKVLKIFNQYKTKQAICNGMSKAFKDSKRASAIYKKLKPLLKSKNKT